MISGFILDFVKMLWFFQKFKFNFESKYVKGFIPLSDFDEEDDEILDEDEKTEVITENIRTIELPKWTQIKIKPLKKHKCSQCKKYFKTPYKLKIYILLHLDAGTFSFLYNHR